METLLRRLRRYRGELLSAAVHLVVYGGCLALFFGLMAINNWPLRHLSRTSGTTLLTWCAMGAAMLAVYGKLTLGKRTRRQLVCGQTIGCLVTDAVTYLQLQIMNVNPNNNATLTLFGPDFPWLLLCACAQILLIVITVCAGAAVYARVYPPRPALLVTGDAADANVCLRGFHAQRRWKVTQVCRWSDAHLAEAICRSEAVFLTSDIPPEPRMALLRQCYEARREVLCQAGLQEILLANARPVIVDDAPYMEIGARRITLWQRLVKRGMDVALSALLLVVLLPLMALIALIILLEDGAPVLFRQTRLTADGRRFTITKFRTMRRDCSPAASAKAHDGRITRAGSFLRRWRLDELPQLWNILRGDMSFVGPRPEMLENVDRYKQALPDFVYRERMKAGLTGYAQIEGRYNTSPEDKLMLDLLYIEGFSLWEDVKLLLRTLTVFFKPDSAQGFPDETASRCD